MLRILFLALLVLPLLPLPALAGPPALLQGQWLHDLVDGLGWSYGLPDKPSDADYQRILSGDRRFHFEAEKTVDKNDVVSIEILHNFGPFSGDGWVEGIAKPTVAHLHFLLPFGGNYRLTAWIRRPGHRFTVGGKQLAADGGPNFKAVLVGTVPLQAGKQTIEDRLPPDGGLDAIELEAPPFPPVQPFGGWQPQRPLTLDDLAVTAARLLDLEPLLPLSDRQLSFEGEAAQEPGTAKITEADYLGAASGGRWLRAGAEKASVTLAFEVPEAGVYRLQLRVLGGDSITGRLDDGQRLRVEPTTFLEDRVAGAFYLAAGTHRLSLALPPRAGFDRLLLQGLASSGSAYRTLVGLPAEGTTPTVNQVDGLLKLLAAIGAPR